MVTAGPPQPAAQDPSLTKAQEARFIAEANTRRLVRLSRETLRFVAHVEEVAPHLEQG